MIDRVQLILISIDLNTAEGVAGWSDLFPTLILKPKKYNMYESIFYEYPNRDIEGEAEF